MMENSTRHAERKEAALRAGERFPGLVADPTPSEQRNWNAELHAQYMVILDERDGLGMLLEDEQKRSRCLQAVVVHYENALREVSRRPTDPNQTASGRLFEVEQIARHALGTTPKKEDA